MVNRIKIDAYYQFKADDALSTSIRLIKKYGSYGSFETLKKKGVLKMKATGSFNLYFHNEVCDRGRSRLRVLNTPRRKEIVIGHSNTNTDAVISLISDRNRTIEVFIFRDKKGQMMQLFQKFADGSFDEEIAAIREESQNVLLRPRRNIKKKTIPKR